MIHSPFVRCIAREFNARLDTWMEAMPQTLEAPKLQLQNMVWHLVRKMPPLMLLY